MAKGQPNIILLLAILAIVALVAVVQFSGRALVGKATGQSCSDSDGGINIFVFGNVNGYDANGNFYKYNDQCSTTNPKTVYERYCNGVYPAVVPQECQFGCSGGKCNTAAVECNDGLDNDGDGHRDYRTVSSDPDSKCTSLTDTLERPRDNCLDTDGGLAVFNRGNVNGYNEDVPYAYSDTCISSRMLREFFCGTFAKDYAPLNSTGNCTGNCTNGACT